MKRLFALILALCMTLSLCSCALIRKIEPADTAAPDTTVNNDSSNVETEFSETKEEDTTNEEIRLTEEEAYEQLIESLGVTDESTETEEGEEPKEAPTVTKTGAIIAQSNGTEYYIFEVEYPEKEAEDDTSADSDTEADSEAEEGGIKPVYVSTNGIIYDALEEANTTTLLAAETYITKHGETDEETGFKYRVEYQGLVKNRDLYCYNFIVYLEDDSSGTVNSVYKTNYLVTLDGKYSGEQKLK